jgi:ribose-phosphate pyrophosphokinase
MIVTDTIAAKQTSPKIKVLSTSDLFSRAIANVNEHGSMSALFNID